jgi:hypothetical protein
VVLRSRGTLDDNVNLEGKVALLDRPSSAGIVGYLNGYE